MRVEDRQRAVVRRRFDELAESARTAFAQRHHDAELVAIHVEEIRGDLGDARRIDAAFVRTTDHARDVAAHLHTCAPRGCQDRFETPQRFGRRTGGVAHGKRLRWRAQDLVTT